MPEYLVLDSEAVSALAHARERAVAGRRARAVVRIAEERNAALRIPAAVLVEVYRGTGRDAAVDRVANVDHRIVPVDGRIARLAGRLLGRRRLASRHAVDALVAATAALLGPSLVLTGDPDDLRKLLADHPHVVVMPLA